MKRLLAFTGALATFIAAYSMLVRAFVPAVPANSWVPTSNDMAQVRAGATATLLADGRVLIAGGVDENGAVTASAERFSPDGASFLNATAMGTARVNHTATLLADGRVLVAGGTGTDGAVTASAEIYDPSANVWAAVGAMGAARRGHTATLLGDGRVFIIGGDAAGAAAASIEYFDPVAQLFVNAGALNVARTQHAAALLADGRVFVAGGTDGAAALASTEIVDPVAGTVAAGPSLTAARWGLTATGLLDGRVLLAGGGDATGPLTAADTFDPATGQVYATGNPLSAARQNHVAVLLPHNNQVLIVGGSAGNQPVGGAEYFIPWQGVYGTFCAAPVCSSGYAGPGTPALARAWAVGGALSFPASETNRSGPGDGLLLLAGGTGQKSAELFGFATVKTDKEDYAPGTTVTITGSGWEPGESVALVLVEQPLLDTHPLVNVTADGDGNIVSTEFVPDEHDLNIRFILTAYGTASQAQTTFRDSRTITKVELFDATTSSYVISPAQIAVVSGGSFTVRVTGTTTLVTPPAAPNATDDWQSTGWTLRGPAPSNAAVAASCDDGVNIAVATVGATHVFSVTAPTTAGTYSLDVVARPADGCGGTPSSSVSYANGIVVSAAPTTITPTFSASNKTYDGNNIASVSYTGPTPAGVTVNYTSATFSDENVANGKTVTVSGINLTGANAGNYTLSATSVTTTANIIEKHVTGSFTADNKAYDGNNVATVLTRSPGAIVAGDDVTLTGGTAAFSDENVANGKTVTLTGAILSGADAGNYILDGVSTTTANITEKHVTGSFTADNKVYDGNNSATVLTRSPGAIVAGEDVTLTGGTATFSDENVANGKTVTLTGAILSGADAGNYILDGVSTTTANITEKHVTGSFTADNKVYDGNNLATVLTRSPGAIVAGDSVTLTGGTATFDNKNKGNGKTVTLTGASLSGADAGNYILDSVATTTANITALDITGSFTAANKTYDGNDDAVVVTTDLQGEITGDDVALNISQADFNNKDVGTGKTVTATTYSLTGADAGNYNLTSVSTTTANITEKHVTGSFTADNKVYDGNNSATVLTRSPGAIVAGEDVALIGGTATFSDENVANGKTVTLTGASLSGADVGNYILDGVSTTTANITVLDITGSFTAANKVYDGNDDAVVVTTDLQGEITGDDVALHISQADFNNKNVGTGKTVTATTYSLTGADAGNYDLTSVSTTTANITEKHVTGSFTADNKVYDGNNVATVLTRSPGAIVAGEDVALIGGTATFSDENVANGKTVTLTGASLSGTDAGNYILDGVSTTTANITVKHITGAFTAANKVWDGNTTATVLTRSLVGAIAGDDVSLSGGTATFADPNVGTGKIVTLTGATLGGADAGNYALDSVATTTADILAWRLTGFYQPVDMTTTPTIVLNSVKGGSTVPLKFNIYAGTTELTATSAVQSFVANQVSCSAVGTIVDDIEFITTGGTSLRYDTTEHQFIQNWRTPKSPGVCFQIIMTAQDGSKIDKAYFKLK